MLKNWYFCKGPSLYIVSMWTPPTQLISKRQQKSAFLQIHVDYDFIFFESPHTKCFCTLLMRPKVGLVFAKKNFYQTDMFFCMIMIWKIDQNEINTSVNVFAKEMKKCFFKFLFAHIRIIATHPLTHPHTHFFADVI